LRELGDLQRRFLLAALAAGLAAGPGVALADDSQRIPLAKAFKYLDFYLALPPSLRSRFYLVFKALRNDRPAPDLKLAIVGQGPPQPVPLDASAQVTHLPTLAQLKSGDALQVWGGPFRFATEIRPNVAPATRLDVGQLDASLTQFNAAIIHIAGPFSAMAVKLDTVLFPDAGSGEMVFADGRTAPLPITHQFKSLGAAPYFRSTTSPGARSVALAKAPSRLLLSTPPQT
jgi:hypothetical protein